MGKFLLGLFGFFLILIGLGYFYFLQTGNLFGFDQTFLFKGRISVNSNDFSNGGEIPIEFTCDGENIAPTIVISQVPYDTKSLVVIMEDASVFPKPFNHWIFFDLNPDTISVGGKLVDQSGGFGKNDFGKAKYNGPCPPAGKTHKYIFRVYALNTTLGLQAPSRPELDLAMISHIIATGNMSGVYSRKP
jgi:Raf kinase inhibitor-like YbhB/YbcL family protein